MYWCQQVNHSHYVACMCQSLDYYLHYFELVKLDLFFSHNLEGRKCEPIHSLLQTYGWNLRCFTYFVNQLHVGCNWDEYIFVIESAAVWYNWDEYILYVL